MGLLPLFESFTLKRPTGGADSEGNPMTGWTVLGTFNGSYGSASARDSQVAAHRGQTVDAFIAMPFADVREGDRVTGLRGSDWDIVAVKDVRIHMRVGIRKVA